MGTRRSKAVSARDRYYQRRFKRSGLVLCVALLLAVAVSCSGTVYPVHAPAEPYLVLVDSSTSIVSTETAQLLVGEATPQPVDPDPAVPDDPATAMPQATEEIEELISIPLPTQGQIIPPSEETHILYYTIAGDSLPMVSNRFGVDMDDITSPQLIERRGLIAPGQLLIIPNNLEVTSSRSKLLPDSEVTFSPSTIDFDIHGFVDEAGGYLSSHTQWLSSTGTTSGADVIARIALEYSVNPRLLLAFLEYQSGWVYGYPQDELAERYPMGYVDSAKEDLYLQSAWFASRVMDGYYGWREGRRLVVNFKDGHTLRLAPQLNAGTVGLMNAFTYLFEYEEWANHLYGDDSFFIFHENIFGNPWIRAQAVEPLIPADVVQPEMILPFEINQIWAFTGGPHPAWSRADVWAALDFAPATDQTGCHESSAWVLASMPGLVVRSGNGVVVIDLDGDGYEQTGWTLLYLHIATKNRIPVGTWVEEGDRIGHPSCEGGRSTGTHVHIARRYNGEWVPADGPLPFTLSGWVARAGVQAYQGWLIRDSDIIFANTSSPAESHIIREE